MRFVNEINISAGDTTGDLTGTPIDASNLFVASVVAVITTAGTGTLTMQASNDLLNPTNWINIPSATTATTGAGTYIIGKQDLAYQWIRVFYLHTSGTGTLTAKVKASGF